MLLDEFQRRDSTLLDFVARGHEKRIVKKLMSSKDVTNEMMSNRGGRKKKRNCVSILWVTNLGDKRENR